MKIVEMKIYAVLLIFLCVNWAQQESTDSKEKPQINFKGTLTDSSGQSFAVENITISGLYKNIPLYAVPADETINPESNTTLIDFNDIEEFRAAPRETQKFTFNNRPYNKVMVVLKNKTENTYLVEATRKIFCDIPINRGSIEKRLSFEALKALVLSGSEPRKEVQPADAPKKSHPHAHECEQAGKVLHELSKEIEKVPEPHKNTISELVDSVKNWVGGICSTSTEKK